MNLSRKVVAAFAGLIVAIGLALLLAVRAHDLSTVPTLAQGTPLGPAFAVLQRIDPWATFAILVVLLGLLFYAALPDREPEHDDILEPGLAELIAAHHHELHEHLAALRGDIAREVEKAAAGLDDRITATLRAGINAQDTQVRKTLDHFNARAGWQIQQLSAKLDGLAGATRDADGASPS
jgi:hypothetical protein